VSGVRILLRFALRGVARHARRSALTGAALAGGIFVMVVLGGLQDGYVAARLQEGLLLQLGHLRVRGAERPLPDPLLLADAFTQDGTALAAAPRLRQAAFLMAGGHGEGALVLGVDPLREARVTRLAGLVTQGAFLPDGPGPPPMVLGRELAGKLGVAPGASVVLHARKGAGLASQTFEVCGLFEAGGGMSEAGLALVRREALALLLGRADGADEVVLRLADPWQAPPLAERLAARPEFAGLALESWRETAPEIAQAMELLGAMERVRTTVLFSLVALGIYTSQSLALASRRREFGMLLALGMAPARLLAVLALELALVACASVATGVLAAAGLIAWLHARGLDLADFGARLTGALEGSTVVRPLFSAQRAGDAALWAAAVALVVLLLPAARLLRLDAATVLRERG
jgi:ABC-type lipoprotein release transport system permease subunit